MQIVPVDRSWLHEFVLAPYLEGCELINLAWKGVDRSLEHNPLSLTDRAIYWLQGAALMIPVVNIIIWYAWQILGDPHKYADPFCPEVHSPVLPPSPVVIHRVAPPSPNGEAPSNVENFGFREVLNGDTTLTDWVVNTYSTEVHATQNASAFSSFAKYRSDLSLKELNYQEGTKTIDFRQDGDTVYVKIGDTETNPSAEEIPLAIPDNLPWIQQRALGLRPFIQSNEDEMTFCAVIPEYPSILGWLLSWYTWDTTPFVINLKATKRGEEDVPGLGRLMKVEITSTRGFPYNRFKSELWFDRNGVLKQFKDTGPRLLKTGELVRNNRLPESAH